MTLHFGAGHVPALLIAVVLVGLAMATTVGSFQTQINNLFGIGAGGWGRLRRLLTSWLSFFVCRGTTWWAVSTVSASGDGTSEATAFKTIAEAVTAASAGDTILILGSFSEAVTCAKAGVRFIGMGTGPGQAVWTAPTVAGSWCLKLTAGYCEVTNIRFRPVAYTTSGVPSGIHLAGAPYTYIHDCRFQGQQDSYKAIYSPSATGAVSSDNVTIDDCEFLYLNTATHGAGIWCVEADNATYAAWRIRRNKFFGCVTAIKLAGMSCEVKDNVIAEQGLAAAGTSPSTVLVLGISMKGSTGTNTGGNVVTRNKLGGTSPYTQYVPGITGDMWTGNEWDWGSDGAPEAGYGPTFWVNNAFGLDTNNGLSFITPFLKLSAAISAVNAYHAVSGQSIVRCTIKVVGTTIPYGTPSGDTIIALPSYCDIIGVGASALGNGGGASGDGGGVPCISGYHASNPDHALAPAATVRGLNLYDLEIAAGAGKDGLHLAAGVALYRSKIVRCNFSDTGTAGAPNAAIYAAGNFAQNKVLECTMASQAVYFVYGLQVVGSITFNGNRFVDCEFFGSTAGVLLPNGINGQNTKFIRVECFHPASAMVKGIDDNDTTGNVTFTGCIAKGTTAGIESAVSHINCLDCTSEDNVTAYRKLTTAD
jgi:hypothetical protein